MQMPGGHLLAAGLDGGNSMRGEAEAIESGHLQKIIAPKFRASEQFGYARELSGQYIPFTFYLIIAEKWDFFKACIRVSLL